MNEHSETKFFRQSWKSQPCTVLVPIPWHCAKNIFFKSPYCWPCKLNIYFCFRAETCSCYCYPVCILPLNKEYLAITTHVSLFTTTGAEPMVWQRCRKSSGSEKLRIKIKTQVWYRPSSMEGFLKRGSLPNAVSVPYYFCTILLYYTYFNDIMGKPKIRNRFVFLLIKT